VAVAVLHETSQPRPPQEQPFTIIGSGFCIDKRGIIVTCAHVIEAFLEKKIKEILDSIPLEERTKTIQAIPETRSLIPHALFYVTRPELDQVHVFAASVDMSMAKTNMDVGLLRLHPHVAFPQGFPSVDVEEFESIYEGMEAATCGFPLGNLLFKQLGTVTSSFSRGIVSSIIPAPGVKREEVSAFQLDLRATHGNSGGPVFSWGSGRVFAVLQGGVDDQYGAFLFARAEPLHRLLDDDTIERFAVAPRPGK
jgi:hypothetical protein